MPELKPDPVLEPIFHYMAIVRELSHALDHALNASDWHEGVVDPSLSQPFREQEEYGNLQMALSRVKGAFDALAARTRALHTIITLREASSVSPSAMATLEAYRRAQPTTHLPSDLQGDTAE